MWSRKPQLRLPEAGKASSNSTNIESRSNSALCGRSGLASNECYKYGLLYQQSWMPQLLSCWVRPWPHKQGFLRKKLTCLSYRLRRRRRPGPWQVPSANQQEAQTVLSPTCEQEKRKQLRHPLDRSDAFAALTINPRQRCQSPLHLADQISPNPQSNESVRWPDLTKHLFVKNERETSGIQSSLILGAVSDLLCRKEN